jgi:predicted ATPase
VETHSEHLILRILRRVREAYENSAAYPASLPKVLPEHIAVVYAEPSAEGTKLHHLKISADGDFIDRWPTGFFTERADELF